MNDPSGFDRTLSAWLEDLGAQKAPARLEDAAIEAARRTTRARPLPDFLTRWLPMTTNFPATRHVPLRRSMPLARLGLALTLLALALLGAALLASIASPSPAVTVRNGRIAFEVNNDIYTVAPDGTDRQLLVEVSVLDGPLAGVAWSPDGTRLAYWTEGSDTQAWQLFVVDADGSDPVVVASGDASTNGLDHLGVAWSPDSSRLAISTWVEGEQLTRFVVAAADGTTGAHQVDVPDLFVRDAAWSPDGKTIAFSSGDGLYLMDEDGTGVRRLDKVGGTGWLFLDVDWSPDGRTIAAAAGLPSDETTLDIWEFAVNGSSERMVSDPLEDPAEQWNVAYAPDGALAWRRLDATMLLEPGGTPQTLAGFRGGPVWSPDGLLMAVADGDSSLVIIDRDGTIVATIGGVHNLVSWQRVPGS